MAPYWSGGSDLERARPTLSWDYSRARRLGTQPADGDMEASRSPRLRQGIFLQAVTRVGLPIAVFAPEERPRPRPTTVLADPQRTPQANGRCRRPSNPNLIDAHNIRGRSSSRDSRQ